MRHPTEPLCPWREPKHQEYYVDVDATQREFEKFEREIAPFTWVEKSGRLVIVSGEDDCGKTSLVHRCADFVDATLNRHGHHRAGDFIIDLGEYPYSSEARGSSPARVAELAEEVYAELLKKGKATWPTVRFDGSRRPDHAAYRIITQFARRIGRTIIVILPPVIDFIDELREYRYLAKANPSVVFFAESPDTSAIEDFLRHKDASGGVIISLRVGPIVEGDGWRFASHRIERCHDVAVSISEADLNAMVHGLMSRDRKISVGSLSKFLNQASESVIATSSTGMIAVNDLWLAWFDTDRFRSRDRRQGE